MTLHQRLAVCSWSLQPESPPELFSKLREVGILRVQCALDPIRDQPSVWGKFAEDAAGAGVTIVSGMFGTIGEDYTTLESIQRTGGVVPDHTWEQNWANFQKTVQLAQAMELSLVTMHAGFLPHSPSDPAFGKLKDRIARTADLFASAGITLGFETGQETAETLRAFLEILNRPQVGVNFDPANIILYDQGDPIAAVRTLGPWLKQVHIKDAIRTRVPGTWGDEVPVGKGQVDWAVFLRTLDSLRFAGNLCIEREAGTQRVADIRAAREHLEQVAMRRD